MKKNGYFGKNRQFNRFILIVALLLNGVGYLEAQTAKVTIKGKDITVKELLNRIEQQTNCTFAYTTGTIDPSAVVNVDVTNGDVATVLTRAIGGIEIEIEGDKIYIKKVPVKKTDAAVVNLTGVVVDEDELPLIGVNVIIEGTSQGTVTDFDGQFTLTDVPADAKVNLSWIGYKTISFAATTHQNRFVLHEDVSQLEEVVVVGYGTSKKANLSGSVDQISSSQIENRMSRNVSQVIQGMAPNLQVTYANGGINEKADFDIRGIGSINGGKPLILIDGVEGDIDYVNPKDIASISILKDASSAAIYGARGAFGVILITTKSPDAGKLKVNYSNSFGWSNPTINTDNFITDGLEWARLSDKLSC